MSRDTIGDFLTMIRNGLKARKRYIVSELSKHKVAIATVLKDQGYVRDYQIIDQEGKPALKVVLKYVNGVSVIHNISRVSRPGRRHYENSKDIAPVIGGLGVSILSTNAGVITDKDAKKLSVGGEVICHVW